MPCMVSSCMYMYMVQLSYPYDFVYMYSHVCTQNHTLKCTYIK